MDTEQYKTEVLPLKNKLYRLALRLLGGQEDARDAVQETFLKLWNLRDRLAAYRSIEAFAMTMIKNHCLDKIKAKRTVSLEEIYLQPESETNTISEERRIETEQTYRKVMNLMGHLTEQQRMIIQMRDVEGYDFEEISEVTELNVNTIRVNLSRARKRLRELYINLENHGNQELAGKILRG